MKRSTTVAGAALLYVCLVYPFFLVADAALRFYGGTASGGTHEFDLVKIDPSNGNTTLAVEGKIWTGMDLAPDGRTLYAVSNKLYTIDIAAGTYREIGPLAFQGSIPLLMVSMTIAPDGQMYAIGKSYIAPGSADLFLYRIDKATGNLEYLGTPDLSVWAIEFAPDGTLYGALYDLMVLDPKDGSTLQTIGPLDSGVKIYELDCSEAGNLYGTSDHSLYQINRTTGQATLLTSYSGGHEVWSLVTKSRPTLHITSVQGAPPGIRWESDTSETYRVSVSADLVAWILASGDLPGSGTGVNSWADDGLHALGPPSGARLRFYKVELF